MTEKVFIFLRLRLGEALLARSKIREFAGLGSLLAEFLKGTLTRGVELPASYDPSLGEVPVLEYVDANTDEVLIGFRVDPRQNQQIIAGRIPPSYQPRMLDPDQTTTSINRFAERAGEDLPPERRLELSSRLVRSQIHLLERIRNVIDDEGNFEVRVPLSDGADE